MGSYLVYVLQSEKDGRYYIGSTEDIVERLARHNRGGVKATSNRLPLRLIYTETFDTRLEALKREKLLKSYKGGQGFKRLIGV